MTRDLGISRHLFVLAFDTRIAAHEAMAAALELVREEKLALAAAAYIHKDRDGVTTIEGAATADDAVPSERFAELMAALVAGPDGALATDTAAPHALCGRLMDAGIERKTVDDIRCLVDPGQTALALLATEVQRDAALEALRRYCGARVVLGTLSPHWCDDVDAALARRPTGVRASTTPGLSARGPQLPARRH